MSNGLNERIAGFYDRSSSLWLKVWGEHMHHGYYPSGQERHDHRQAQKMMMDRLIEWGELKNPKRILDAGCGVGGSARYLAGRFGADVKGCTLSVRQAEMGNILSREAGLQGQVELIRSDMLQVEPEDGRFDLIWSLESAEHVAEKPAMFSHFYRLLHPGGKFLMATWCHRPLPPALDRREQKTLHRVFKAYHLPGFVGLSDLKNMAVEAGFKNIRSEDWSEYVLPFWPAVIRSAFSPRALAGLYYAGRDIIRAALSMGHMRKGLAGGLIRFGVIQGTRA